MPIGYSSFVTPVGNLPPQLTGGRFSAAFSNTASFIPGAGGSCAAGEYRQYVRGSFTANGTTIMHRLCGSTFMSPTVFQEDGCPSGFCTAYGHRACPPHPTDMYLPTRATGCQYAMSCAPGFTNVQPGMVYGINLAFRGALLDTSSNQTIVTRNWTVSGQIMVPRTAGPLVRAVAAAGLQTEDRVVDARVSRNLDHGGSELHIVVGRPDGSPPLSPTAVSTVLRDAGGDPLGLGDPVTHEVSFGRQATTTIVYPVTDAGRRPVSAEVASDIANTVFEIKRR